MPEIALDQKPVLGSASCVVLFMHSLAALAAMIPYFIDAPLLLTNEEEMADKIYSPIHMYSTCMAIAVSFPMIFDNFMGGVDLTARPAFARYMMLLALVVPNSIILYSQTLPVRPAMALFICSFEIRSVLLFGSILGYSAASANTRSALFITFAMSILVIVQCNVYVWEPFVSHPGGSYASLSQALTLITLVAVVAIIAHHTKDILVQGNWNLKLNRRTVLVANMNLLGFNVILKIVIFFSYGTTSWDNVVSSEVALFNMLDCVCVVVVFNLTGRIILKELLVAQALLETKKNFVRCISHEVRTPLNTVRLGVQLLLERQSELSISEEAGQILRDINASCELSIDVLNELLLYDKMENNSVIIEIQETDIYPLLMQTLAPFIMQARQVGVNLCGDGISEELKGVTVGIDRNKFSVVLRNLISNSIKFSQADKDVYFLAFLKRSNALEATPSMCTEDSSNRYFCRQSSHSSVASSVHAESPARIILRIEVKDFGPGISKENQKKLFNEIIQFNPAELQQGNGSGIGLWLSKAIVDRHGGRIGVESSGVPGEGSLFYVELDVSSKASFEDTVQSPSLCSTKRSFDRLQGEYGRLELSSFCSRAAENSPLVEAMSHICGPKRILIVDDSALSRKMVAKVLSFERLDFNEACDGSEAVRAFSKTRSGEQQEYDIIIMDSVMPTINGMEATRQLRKLGFTGFIAGVTGNAHQEEVTGFLSSGADSVYSKPLSTSDVRSIIRDAELKRDRADSAAAREYDSPDGNSIYSREIDVHHHLNL